MLRLWCTAALGLLVGCAPAVKARPAGSGPAFAAPGQADPLRAEGPAQILSVGEIHERIRRSPHTLTLLHVWATWCSPCVEELPLMADLADRLPARGIALLSVSLDDPSARSAVRVGRVIDGRARGQLTRAIARFENADAFIESVDPQWEGSIPALFAFGAGGKLVGALYGEATRAEIETFVGTLQEPTRGR
ncbi:MAG: TlpA family protein disulfide reductase [Myxococcales bacterium]|nr:TlpA family protein disulfide reductase [Myxococcales bacterium]